MQRTRLPAGGQQQQGTSILGLPQLCKLIVQLFGPVAVAPQEPVEVLLSTGSPWPRKMELGEVTFPDQRTRLKQLALHNTVTPHMFEQGTPHFNPVSREKLNDSNVVHVQLLQARQTLYGLQ